MRRLINFSQRVRGKKKENTQKLGAREEKGIFFSRANNKRVDRWVENVRDSEL